MNRVCQWNQWTAVAGRSSHEADTGEKKTNGETPRRSPARPTWFPLVAAFVVFTAPYRLVADANARPDETVEDLLVSAPVGGGASDSAVSLTALSKVLLSVGAIVALGFLALSISRRYRSANQSHAGEKLVRVLSRTALAPRQSVYVLEVAGSRWVLVGVTPDRMQPLLVLDAAEATGGRSWSPPAGESAPRTSADLTLRDVGDRSSNSSKSQSIPCRSPV